MIAEQLTTAEIQDQITETRQQVDALMLRRAEIKQEMARRFNAVPQDLTAEYNAIQAQLDAADLLLEQLQASYVDASAPKSSSATEQRTPSYTRCTRKPPHSTRRLPRHRKRSAGWSTSAAP